MRASQHTGEHTSQHAEAPFLHIVSYQMTNSCSSETQERTTKTQQGGGAPFVHQEEHSHYVRDLRQTYTHAHPHTPGQPHAHDDALDYEIVLLDSDTHIHSHAHAHAHTHDAVQTHVDGDSHTPASEPSLHGHEHGYAHAHAHAHSHRAPGSMTQQYLPRSYQRWLMLLALVGLMVVVALFAIRFGAYPIALDDLLQALLGQGEATTQVAIWRIRMPRIVGAMVCGWALALSGLGIQSLLKNPLASPSTIGISQGAAFGAAASIVLWQAQFYLVTAFAFAGAMGATAVVLSLASLKRLSTEAVVLSGVALSSLFTSGTILLQFLASDTQLAMVVFWTFGDVARAGWREIAMISIGVTLASLYLYSKRWDMNALLSGEEAAKGLGVNVRQTRMAGVVVAALVAAMATAFFGVIAFVGLVAPHVARRLVGADHRLTVPFSCVLGALLLLASDTIGRVIIGTGSLPVGVITSCLGAPVFLYMLVKSYR